MILFVFATTLQVFPQGYIVPNGVRFGGYDPFFGSQIQVAQNAANSDYTGFSLKPSGITSPSTDTNTFSYSFFLDEGVRVFKVFANQPISLAPIMSQSYPELSFPNSYVFNSGISFYVGLYTGYSPNNGIYTDPLFGWAQLVNNQGVIQLLDGALVYGAGGIYAGTQTIISIPEPSTLALTGIGALLAGCFCRKNSRVVGIAFFGLRFTIA